MSGLVEPISGVWYSDFGQCKMVQDMTEVITVEYLAKRQINKLCNEFFTGLYNSDIVFKVFIAVKCG